MGPLVARVKGFTLVELMVVIVIVGILAAVAIPKFLDASQKAKASEFPTELTAVYTGEIAYYAERGTYATAINFLKDSGYVDVPGSTRWFKYSIPVGSGTAFVAEAKVNTPFGITTSSDSATIDQTNSKSATPSLMRYCPNWK
jgi:prepilin-type N-terminal cleavage/methylation domain-containing protein